MTDPNRTTAVARLVRTVVGSIVVLLTAPTGVGPVAGGWIAATRTGNPARGAVAAGLAGLAGTLPWTALVYLASTGAIDPIGYHDGLVHVGVMTAAPGTLAPWHEVGIAVLFTGTLVALSVCGGVVAGSRRAVLGDRCGDVLDG